jgi:hypothetical protein
VVDVGGDAAVPRANGDDDKVCRNAASPMMSAATSIACWRVAGVRLECVGATGVVLRFRRDGRQTAAGFWQRGRGGGGIYSRRGLGEGLGLGPISVNRTATAGTVSRADSPSGGCS